MVTSNYSKGVNPEKLLLENFPRGGKFFAFLTYFQKEGRNFLLFKKLIFEQRK
jgi:hypothetical protein